MSQITDLVDSLGNAEDGVSVVYPDTFRDDILAAAAGDADLSAAELVAVTGQRDAAAAEVVKLKGYIADYIVGSAADAGDDEDSDDMSGGDDNPEDSDDKVESDFWGTEKDND